MRAHERPIRRGTASVPKRTGRLHDIRVLTSAIHPAPAPFKSSRRLLWLPGPLLQDSSPLRYPEWCSRVLTCRPPLAPVQRVEQEAGCLAFKRSTHPNACCVAGSANEIVAYDSHHFGHRRITRHRSFPEGLPSQRRLLNPGGSGNGCGEIHPRFAYDEPVSLGFLPAGIHRISWGRLMRWHSSGHEWC